MVCLPLLFALLISNVIDTNNDRSVPISVESFLNVQPPQTVAFCELVKHPESYENRLVRVRASYVSNFESSMLYDLRCDSRENHVDLIPDCSSEESCKLMRET